MWFYLKTAKEMNTDIKLWNNKHFEETDRKEEVAQAASFFVGLLTNHRLKVPNYDVSVDVKRLFCFIRMIESRFRMIDSWCAIIGSWFRMIGSLSAIIDSLLRMIDNWSPMICSLFRMIENLIAVIENLIRVIVIFVRKSDKYLIYR